MIGLNKDINSESIIIKINYNNNLYQIQFEKNKDAKELRYFILNKFNLDDSFILSYRNQKIAKDDFTPIHFLFKNDSDPLIFINDNNTILPNIKSNHIIILKSNLSQQKLLNILNSFFLSKFIPFNASINNIEKGVYKIKFINSQLSSEFMNYYNKRIHKTDLRREKYFNLMMDKNKTKEYSNDLIKINNKFNLPQIKQKNMNKTSSRSEIVANNVQSLALSNVIKENSKSAYISQKIIEQGINHLRPSQIKKKENGKIKKDNIKRRFYINEKYINEDYEGIYLFPFMSEEEKYVREKYLDKKKWINKDGFVSCVGKYKMKNYFIPNYVNATPSEPPSNHHFRDVNKNKWINKSGFII